MHCGHGHGALGSTLVRLLVARGEQVVAVDVPLRGALGLSGLEKELGPNVLGATLDVASVAAWPAVLAAAEARFGPVFGAVLVAGGWQGGKPLHAEADDATSGARMRWTAISSPRTARCARCCRASSRAAREHRGGGLARG